MAAGHREAARSVLDGAERHARSVHPHDGRLETGRRLGTFSKPLVRGDTKVADGASLIRPTISDKR